MQRADLRRFSTILMVLVLAGFACTLTGPPPTPAVQETVAALKSTQVTLEQTLAAAEPPPAREPHLVQPGNWILIDGQRRVYVWAGPEGCLSIQSAGQQLAATGICLPGERQSVAWRAQRWMGWSAEQVSVPDLKQNQLVILAANGDVTRVSGPAASQQLADARLSPNGTYIYWIYDVTQVAPRPMEDNSCDARSGCVGREYAHYLTDREGRRPVMFGILTVNSQNYPAMEIAAWRSDSKAVFLRRNANVPTRYYPDCGGGITRVNVPFGSSDPLSEEYLAFDTQFSPGGTWQVDSNDVDDKTALRIESAGGEHLSIPFDSSYSPLVYQITFSSDERWVYWIALLQDRPGGDLTGLQLVRWEMNTAASPQILWQSSEVDENDLPYINTLLSPDLVVVNDASETRIFDVKSSRWVILPDMPGEGWPLLGWLMP